MCPILSVTFSQNHCKGRSSSAVQTVTLAHVRLQRLEVGHEARHRAPEKGESDGLHSYRQVFKTQNRSLEGSQNNGSGTDTVSVLL